MNRFDQIAKEWDAKPRRLLQAENIFKAIKQKVNLSDTMSVLDIGTGTGLLLMHFITEVREITGIDNSQGMLDMLKEKAEKAHVDNIRYLLFDADTDHLNGQQYDLAVSSLTFHHFKSPDAFLKEIYTSLKPGGKVCIGDLVSEDGSFHTDNEEVGVHHFGFDKQIFNQWLKDAGFINTSVETVFTITKNDKQYPVLLAYGEKGLS